MMLAPLIAGALQARHEQAAAVSIAATAPPSVTVVSVAGAIAAVLVLGLWSVTGHIITIAHEGAHAATAVLLGGKVTEVRLHRDRTGSTTSARALLALPVAAAGYLGPSAFGLLGSGLIVHGRPDVVLWISLALLGLLLVTTANWFGRFVVIITAALLFVTLHEGSPTVRLLVACAWVWVLLIGGLLHVWRHRRGGVDFAIMHSITGVVPAFFWAGLALAVTAAALVTGGAWLVGAATPPL
jgi:hypothetical protein